MASSRPTAAIPASAPSANRPSLKWDFISWQIVSQSEPRYARGDRAVGDDLDVAVRQQHVDQHAVVARRVPDAELRRTRARRARAASCRTTGRAGRRPSRSRSGSRRRAGARRPRSPPRSRRSTSGVKRRRVAPARREEVLEACGRAHATSVPRRRRRRSRRRRRRNRRRRRRAETAAAPAAGCPAAAPRAARPAAAAAEPSDERQQRPTRPTPSASPSACDDEPGDAARDAAGRQRAERRGRRSRAAPPSRRTRSMNRIGRIAAAALRPVPVLLRRRQRLAVDDADHAVDARRDAAGEVALAEARRDRLVDDAVGDEVRERALEPAADLDAKRAVVLRDEQQRAVVRLLAAELPRVDDADRVLLDRLGLRGRHDQHGDLAPLRASNAASFARGAARSAGVSVPVRSVTRAASGGTGSDCAAPAPQPRAAACRGHRGEAASAPRAALSRRALPLQVAGSAGGFGRLRAAPC